MVRCVAAFLLAASVCDAADDDQYWRLEYNPSNHTQYYQSIIPHTGTDHWWPHAKAHGPGQRGSNQWLSSNPNTLNPWARPAGCNGISAESLGIERVLRVPAGKYIEIRKTMVDVRGTVVYNGRRPYGWKRPKYNWTYPIGTKISEELFHDGRLFADREREKVGPDDWEPTKADVFFEPPGYVEVVGRDCKSCHKDAGTNVTRLEGDRPGREWYGDLRGDDHVFSFRPINLDGSIPERWKGFVRYAGDTTASS